MRVLLKHKLVHHENVKYDGYRLTPLVCHPYCCAALHTAWRRRLGAGQSPALGCTQHARTFAPDCLFSTTRNGRRAKEPWH